MKITLTPEQRQVLSERMKRNRQNPAFEAKRAAAVKAAFEADADRGVIRRKISQANKEQWKDPVIRRKRLSAIAKGLDNGTREKRAAILAERRKDPAYEEKRLAGIRRKCAEQPFKKRAVALANARKRRGFDVPARLWDEYRRLQKKGLLAREAGIALGLIRQ